MQRLGRLRDYKYLSVHFSEHGCILAPGGQNNWNGKPNREDFIKSFL